MTTLTQTLTLTYLKTPNLTSIQTQGLVWALDQWSSGVGGKWPWELSWRNVQGEGNVGGCPWSMSGHRPGITYEKSGHPTRPECDSSYWERARGSLEPSGLMKRLDKPKGCLEMDHIGGNDSISAANRRWRLVYGMFVVARVVKRTL